MRVGSFGSNNSLFTDSDAFLFNSVNVVNSSLLYSRNDIDSYKLKDLFLHTHNNKIAKDTEINFISKTLINSMTYFGKNQLNDIFWLVRMTFIIKRSEHTMKVSNM